MKRILVTLTAGLAAAMVAAAPATATPTVTVKGAKDNTITARLSSVEASSACTLFDISTGKSVSGTTAADGTATLVLTQMRLGPHAVNVTCVAPNGAKQVLTDHRPAPITR
ncbi:hypothetical protein [Nocardia concava]|uniref:hypothetical protein n=1 Tax=Nocardia concava TaxID=257281 RepID=UPI0002EDE6A3|nr:hypothetical protein [Nocardia concava]